MNVQFKASFAKDLRNIKNRDVLNRIREAVEELEKAQSLQNITNIKKLRGGGNYPSVAHQTRRKDELNREH